MEYKYEQQDGIIKAIAKGKGWSAKLEKAGDISVFKFTGKTPPRRVLRQMIKDCEKLVRED